MKSISSNINDESRQICQDHVSWKVLRQQLIPSSGSVTSATSTSTLSSAEHQAEYFISSDTRVSSDIYRIEHIVLPNDTLEGVCIQYKINSRSLKQVNRFSGSSLLLAPKRLIIPIRRCKLRTIKQQDRTTEEYKTYKFMAEIGSLKINEIKAYLELTNWDLEVAIASKRRCRMGKTTVY